MFDLTKRRREKFQKETEFSFGRETETDIIMEKSSSLSDERVWNSKAGALNLGLSACGKSWRNESQWNSSGSENTSGERLELYWALPFRMWSEVGDSPERGKGRVTQGQESLEVTESVKHLLSL